MSVTLIVAGILLTAVQAIRTERLLVSALWLAATSALVALLLYLLGAPEVAAIELSVGAGLVTVLFVFAINIAGDDPLPARAVVPRPLAWTLVLASAGLLASFAVPGLRAALPVSAPGDRLASVVWEQRNLDVLLQVVLIFAGVLGVIGLLADDPCGGETRV